MATRTLRTAIAAGLLALAGAVLVPAPAWAVGGTAFFDSGGLLINVDSTGDEIAIVDVGTSVRVSGDKGMTLIGGVGCTQVNAFVVQCPKAPIDFWELNGSNAADTVFANGTDVPGELFLGGGNDYLQVGRGKDFIHGDGGYDTISYNPRTAPVTISMNGENDDGEAGEDDYIFNDVEAVYGGLGDDVFWGNAAHNEFRGGHGNDTFHGTVGADDLFEGYLGFDSVVYDVPASVPLDISLDDEVAKVGSSGQTDTLFTLEMVVGGAGNDTLTGSSLPDWLVGGGGQDVLRGLNGGDVLYAEGNGSTVDGGEGDDKLVAYQGTGKRLIGGGGVDTVSYAGYVEWDLSAADYATAPVTVDLDGAADDGYAGQKDKVSTDIENIEGTHGFGDKLTGNAKANVIWGFGGNDTLKGSGGSDVIHPQQVFGPATDHDVVNGGGGKDMVSYADENVGVDVSINNQADDGPAGDFDNVKNDVEGIQGGAGNDTLNGGSAANTLLGGPGNDDLFGLGGADVLDGEGGADDIAGGTGSDTVSYEDRVADVEVTLDGFVGDGEAGENDNVASDIENIVGGHGDDTLVGTNGVNKIYGGSGSDIVSGLGGNDVLDLGDGDDTVDAGVAKDGADKILGGNGVDVVSYADRTAVLKVTINGSAGDGEAGENDHVMVDVENLIGGAGADKLTGSAVANSIMGGDGADTIVGGAGNDALYGFGGADTLDGGADIDFADGGPGINDPNDRCLNVESSVNCEYFS